MYIAIKGIVILSNFLITCIVIRCLLSWFRPDPYGLIGNVYQFTIRITEPICEPFRRLLSRYNTGPFDFSVLLALIAIQVVTRILIRILVSLYI